MPKYLICVVYVWLLYLELAKHTKAQESNSAESEEKMALFLLFNVFFTQRYGWAQHRVEFFLSDTRDINAHAFNSSGVSLAHFCCTWISKYSLLPGKVGNTKIK